MSSDFYEIRDIVQLYFHEPYSSFLMGVTYGVPVRISKDITQQIMRSGLTHLIVLSGANITALLFLVEEIYKYIGKKNGLIVYFIFLGWFISIVGFEPPLFRALVMYICACICIFTGRPVNKMWNLWLSIWIVAIVKPEWIYSRSFHLSVVATVGLIMGSEIAKHISPGKVVFLKDVSISVSVFLTTLPLTIFYFKSIALMSPLATVAAGMIISPLMICGLFIPVAHALFPPLAYLISIPAHMMLIALEFIIHAASSIPYTFIQWQ